MGNQNVNLEPYGQDGKDGAGTAFRVIGILIWVLGAIGGILLLVAVGSQSSRAYSYYGSGNMAAAIAGGGIAGALVVWITAFISGLTFFGFGEVIKLLAMNATKKYHVTGDLSALVAPAVQAAPPMPSPAQAPQQTPAREPVRFSWRPAAGTTMICPVCGCQQESLRPSCRQCGVQFLYPES